MSAMIQGALPQFKVCFSGLLEKMGINCISKHITDQQFPLPENLYKPEYEVFYFNQKLSSQEAVDRIRIRGFEPANYYELATWDGFHGCGSTIALGTAVKISGTIHRFVFILFALRSKGNLSLLENWHSYTWPSCSCFLGVKRPFTH